jgi:MYXO-CTERM domain-containing protein
MMKVKALVICVAMMMAAGSAMADSYTYEFDRDVTSMNHSKAYLWGINHDIPDDEEVIGATLTIKNIYNSNDQRNEIFINLKDYAATGWTTYGDSNNDFVDYFENHSDITPLVHYEDINGVEVGSPYSIVREDTVDPETLVYEFTPEDLATLVEYMDYNNFGITIDPDCHYYLDGIELEIVTQPGPPDQPPGDTPVAEPAGLGLLGLALMAARRRRS